MENESRHESEKACVTDRITSIRAEIRLRRAASPQTLLAIESLLREYPDSAELWILRGDALRIVDALGTDEALRSYEHAVALDPGNSEAERAIKTLRESQNGG